mgnify:CR=1 FL=1|jgi:hypothetical protein
MLFNNTIFDQRKPVKQTEFFEYAAITVSLLINPKLTIKVWEQTVEYMDRLYDTGSMRNTDME